jgi:hypothetical protein
VVKNSLVPDLEATDGISRHASPAIDAHFMRTEPMLTALMLAPQWQPDWIRIDAGHELAREQMPVAHHLLTAVGFAA